MICYKNTMKNCVNMLRLQIRWPLPHPPPVWPRYIRQVIHTIILSNIDEVLFFTTTIFVEWKYWTCLWGTRCTHSCRAHDSALGVREQEATRVTVFNVTFYFGSAISIDQSLRYLRVCDKDAVWWKSMDNERVGWEFNGVASWLGMKCSIVKAYLMEKRGHPLLSDTQIFVKTNTTRKTSLDVRQDDTMTCHVRTSYVHSTSFHSRRVCASAKGWK